MAEFARHDGRDLPDLPEQGWSDQKIGHHRRALSLFFAQFTGVTTIDPIALFLISLLIYSLIG